MAIVKTNVEVPEVLLNRIREAVGSSNLMSESFRIAFGPVGAGFIALAILLS